MRQKGELTLQDFSAYCRRFDRCLRLRPMPLAMLAVRLLGPRDRRRVVATRMGTRLWLDPVTVIAREIADRGEFEPATRAVLDAELRPGHTFLDVGANEGVFTAYAARRLGPDGTVIAVEPQERLRPIIESNLRLNPGARTHVVTRALGEADGAVRTFKLYPELNSGGSSFIRGPRSGARSVNVRFVSPQQLLADCGVERIDLAKVDVEGYEGRVIDALLPLLRQGRIGKLLVDFHAPILRQINVSITDLHRQLLDAGMSSDRPPAATGGYHLYRRIATMPA